VVDNALDVLWAAIRGALMCDMEGPMVGALRPRTGPRQKGGGGRGILSIWCSCLATPPRHSLPS